CDVVVALPQFGFDIASRGTTSMQKRIVLVTAILLTVLLAANSSAANNSGLSRLATAPLNVDGSSDGFATFGGATPTSAQLDALRALGLRVQGLDQLPLALLRGPRGAMFDAVSRGAASDVYPNERLTYYSAASDMAIRANEVQALGIDGSGVGVRSEEHTSELQSRFDLVCRLLLDKKTLEVAIALDRRRAPWFRSLSAT